ncbi:unnamed protein product [Rhizophagus irregularis]|nr:unnamed protein product [Rhizophagus irregularis]
MSSESFTLFLHIAMSSAMEGFRKANSYWQAKRTKELGELDAQFQALNRRVAKLSKNSEKSKKKSKKNKKKSQQGSVTNSDISADEIDEIDKMVDDNNLYSEDRDLNINWPIVAVSGSQSNVDHSVNMEVAPIEPVVQSDIEKSKPQLKQIPEKSSTDLTKSSNKNKRSNKNLIEKVITGHKPTDDDTSKVRDILVYDVPIELSTFRLAQFEVNENPTWTTDLGGIPVRWFPARWTLKERKQREKFQATIRKIPDSMTGLKSFKIIQTARGERKLIGYFEKWVDMRNALDNQFVWDQLNLSWNRYEPPTQQTRSRGSNANKNQRTSGSQSTSKSQQGNSKSSKKKPGETKFDKPKKQKKDKSRKASRSKVLAEIIDVLRKLI